MLCLDLIITLKKPLISGKDRMIWYHSGVVLVVICQLIYTEDQIYYQCFNILCTRYDECEQDLEKCHLDKSNIVKCKRMNEDSKNNAVIPWLFISYLPVLISELFFYVLGIFSIIMAFKSLNKTKYISGKDIY